MATLHSKIFFLEVEYLQLVTKNRKYMGKIPYNCSAVIVHSPSSLFHIAWTNYWSVNFFQNLKIAHKAYFIKWIWNKTSHFIQSSYQPGNSFRNMRQSPCLARFHIIHHFVYDRHYKRFQKVNQTLQKGTYWSNIAFSYLVCEKLTCNHTGLLRFQSIFLFKTPHAEGFNLLSNGLRTFLRASFSGLPCMTTYSTLLPTSCKA